jgi:hypothetical protein
MQAPHPASVDAIISFLHGKAGLDPAEPETKTIARHAKSWGASTDPGGILNTASLIHEKGESALARLSGNGEVGEILAKRAADAFKTVAAELQGEHRPASRGSGQRKRARRESTSSSSSSARSKVARAGQSTLTGLYKLVQKSTPDELLREPVNEAVKLNLCWSQRDVTRFGHAGGVQEGRGEGGGGLTPKGRELMLQVTSGLLSSEAWEEGEVQQQYPTLRGLGGTVCDDEGEWTPELAEEQLKEWFHSKLSRANEQRAKGEFLSRP